MTEILLIHLIFLRSKFSFVYVELQWWKAKKCFMINFFTLVRFSFFSLAFKTLDSAVYFNYTYLKYILCIAY